jgi:hypothetical protein
MIFQSNLNTIVWFALMETACPFRVAGEKRQDKTDFFITLSKETCGTDKSSTEITRPVVSIV